MARCGLAVVMLPKVGGCAQNQSRDSSHMPEMQPCRAARLITDNRDSAILFAPWGKGRDRGTATVCVAQGPRLKLVHRQLVNLAGKV